MEVVTISVVETTETVTINVSEGFGSVTNSDGSYNDTVNVGQTLVVPDSSVENTDGTYIFPLPATQTHIVPDTLIENSDSSWQVLNPAVQAYTVPDTTIKNTDGDTILVQPSATNTGVIADCRVVNSDLTYDELVPAETTHNLPDITVTEPDSTTYAYPAAKDITLPDNRNLNVQFLATYDDNITITSTADEATTWTTEALINVATIAYEKNGGAASLPITLAASDTLKITITRTNAALDSKVKLTNA